MEKLMELAIEFWNEGMEISAERHAFLTEVHIAAGELLEEASPKDIDSPSRLTGKELLSAVADRVGAKLLGKFS